MCYGKVFIRVTFLLIIYFFVTRVTRNKLYWICFKLPLFHVRLLGSKIYSIASLYQEISQNYLQLSFVFTKWVVCHDMRERQTCLVSMCKTAISNCLLLPFIFCAKMRTQHARLNPHLSQWKIRAIQFHNEKLPTQFLPHWGPHNQLAIAFRQKFW